uniref:RZ-type domain-containing protein n=1 Tax=Strigamia maritima TaxID=126957 RepID=T1IT09_STRMM
MTISIDPSAQGRYKGQLHFFRHFKGFTTFQFTIDPPSPVMSKRNDKKDFSQKHNFSEEHDGKRSRGRGRGNRNRGRDRGRSASVSTECLFTTNPALRRTSFGGSNVSLASNNGRDRERDRGRGSRGRGRGNHSGPNFNDRGNGRGRGGGRSGHSGPKYNEQGDRRDVRPLRFRQVQELFNKDPNEIIITLVDQSNGFKELLNGPSIGVEMLVDILKMLSKAFSTTLHHYNQNSILAEVLASQLFSNHVSKIIFSRDVAANLHIFELLADIFVTFFDKMPDITCDELEIYVRQCEAAAKPHQRYIDKQVLVSIQDLLIKMENLQEEKKNELMRKKKVKLDYANYQDEPPDDYRQTDIIPSIEEITAKGRPFLRPNIVQGAYKDADHYLDVQFRLLRECFISPLRDGIADFLYRDKRRTIRIRKLRIFDVRIIEPLFNKSGMVYRIQFNTNQFRRVKWEMTNRLIFGSLLCLSPDNFATAIFASVADRKPEDLKKGIVTVKFEDELETRKELTKTELKAVYIMAESQAYFESFRHVLRGLQTFNSENLPLQKYIIDVQRWIEPPDYLDYETTFDFTNAMNRTDEKDDLLLAPKERPRLHRARVVDIHTWPAPETMGLDESQRRAMHLALSSAVAVIQGPPGTGKTYMGLKMVKMLLSNKHVWRQDGESNPILVVCLTNHALDQFLEGMLKFTNSLIRVGGRSKNESLGRYNLKFIKDRMFCDKRREGYIHRTVEQCNVKLSVLRQKMELEKQKGLLLNVQILHEEALEIMSGEDKRLVESLTDGFIDFNELDFDPRGLVWCPTSFLATWLGLAMNEFVTELDLEDFLHDESNEFEVVGKKRKIEQPTAQLDYQLLAEDEAEMDSDDGLIDVEDEAMAANRHRQLEAEEMEEVQLKVPSLNSGDWSVIVDRLVDPEYLMIQQNNYQMVMDDNGVERMIVDQMDPDMYKLYQRMGSARKEIANRELGLSSTMSDEEIFQVENVWNLSFADRWKLYRRWIRQFQVCVEERMIQLQRQYETEAKKLKEVINAEELSILRDKDIIGMTTTGAAKYLETLRELKPSIVIVEEAAEVLEAHIITTLSSSTKHLILIGDHKQLRPSVSVYRLSQDYHMDISLFERLIRNNVRYETLQLQHRMRPEISQILKPHIYETLEDHPSVREYPRVKGITTSLFFLNHENAEESVTDSTTRKNPFEAKFLVALCRYLLQQGYDTSQITILAAYAGQLFELRKLMDKNTFEGVKVTVVDNYQGEENDIILLSFVRSNEEGQIGFLKIDNRINVALSRAKIGLYCVGNFKFFASKSQTWRKICNYLEIQGYTGDEMTLQCQKHGQLTIVRNDNDFRSQAPEGGCLEVCNDKLPCGHYCSRVCHVTEHSRCEQKCNKVLCELQHTCPSKCYQICEPCRVKVMKYHLNCEHSEYQPCFVDIATVKCKVLVKRDLRCGHLVTLECHIDVEHYDCLVTVNRELPHCKHERVMKCFQDPEKVNCKVNCEARLECGHACPRTCHPMDDPEHEDVECRKRCEKKICERGHKCNNLCYQACNKCLIFVEKERPCGHKIQHPCSKEIIVRPPKSRPQARFLTLDDRLSQRLLDEKEYVEPCVEPCKLTLDCTHPCKLKCSETCGDCKEIIDKIMYCGHMIKAECRTRAASLVCTAACKKYLLCGHLCLRICGDVCETKCSHLVNRRGLCGHVVETPCHLARAPDREIAQYCKHPCNLVLDCQHQCKGTCGTCRQGRVHIPCKETCGRLQICGHSCTFPCALVCPPCNEMCSTQCVHSRCQNRCGQSCKKCKERCAWRCTHLQCNTKCGELCTRDPCNVACQKVLICGHPCIGLCGEKCPKLCRICNREELLEFVLSGNEEDDDARFIELADCGHCIEVEGLDYWMQLEIRDDGVKMKDCPRCKTTIWKSLRYGNIIKQRMDQNLRNIMHQVHEEIKKNRRLPTHFPKECKRLVGQLTGKQPVHQNQLVIIQNQVKILTLMTNSKEKFNKEMQSSEAKRYFEVDLEFLVDRLMKNEEKMSEIEIRDIGIELTRIELYTMYMNAEYVAKGNRSTVTEVHLTTAKRMLAKSSKLTEAEAGIVEDAIRKAADLVPGLGITHTERLEIVKAIDLQPGHWFECRNGHLYVITECGGAMETSKCPECGVKIGGGNHDLLAGNAHTSVMDGSRHAAYSDLTGIGNFDLDNLI